MKKYIRPGVTLSFCICAALVADKPQAPGFEPTEVTSTGSVTGHTVSVHLPALEQLRDNVAGFIRSTDNLN